MGQSKLLSMGQSKRSEIKSLKGERLAPKGVWGVGSLKEKHPPQTSLISVLWSLIPDFAVLYG